MHYVKQFNINGVDTKQVACIELQGAPNAATEGAVGVLGMDMLSPTHEVYRCVAVNGSVYTWELLSAGMSIISATITGEGGETKSFLYSELRIPNNYLIKVGDLILDSEGYLYQITTIGATSCDTSYCGTHIGGISSGDNDYSLVVKNGKLQLVTESGAVISNIDYLKTDEDTLCRNSSTGVASVRGVKTINGTSLRLFVGTKAEYDALTDAQKKNLFAIISDDPTKENMENGKINAVSLEGGISIESGDFNDYYEVGNYYVGSIAYAPNIANMPIQTAGVLKVISGTGFIAEGSEWFCVIQIFIAHHDGSMYSRQMTHDSRGNHWTDWQAFVRKKMSDVLVYLDDRNNNVHVKDRVYLNFRHTVENLSVDSISSFDEFKEFILNYCNYNVQYPVTGGKGLVTFMSIMRTSADEIYLVNMTTTGMEMVLIDDVITESPMVYSEIKTYY